jgi:hypothetical protein
MADEDKKEFVALHINVPRELHRQFKMKCAELEIKQNEVILTAVEKFSKGQLAFTD